MIYGRFLVGIVALLVAAGCTPSPGGGSISAPQTPQPPPTAQSTPTAPSAAERCGGSTAASTALRIASPDTASGGRSAGSAVLAAYEVGSGPRGVVLVPELGRRNLCGWWTYAVYLASHGLRVLIFDHQCTGQSTCPATSSANALVEDITAAAAALHRDGAQRTVLIGASQGGAEVLIAAARPPAAVAGVVAVSADSLTETLAGTPYPPTAMTAAPQLTLPELFVVAASDQYVSVADTRALMSSRHSRLVVVPSSSGHGWDLLDAASNPPSSPSDDVVEFLTEVLR